MPHVHSSAQTPPVVLGPTCQLQPQLSTGDGVKKLKRYCVPRSFMKTGGWEKMRLSQTML